MAVSVDCLLADPLVVLCFADLMLVMSLVGGFGEVCAVVLNTLHHVYNILFYLYLSPCKP